MNLVHDGWIPVIDDKQASRLVSLITLYEKAEILRDLAVNPPQRIALMRLLICITQAALDGPEDEEAWLDCQPEIMSKSLDYLEKHADCFELYGEKAFLQVPDLICDEKNYFEMEIDKLNVVLASGNARTLLNKDDVVGFEKIYKNANIALDLLTYQNFAIGGGKSTTAKWGDESIDGHMNEKKENRYTSGPCSGSKLFTFIVGQNILETIFMNLITREMLQTLANAEWGIPILEKFPESYSGKRSSVLRNQYLARLVPLSRFLSIDENNKKKIKVITNGFSYNDDPLNFQDPMLTVTQYERNKQTITKYLKCHVGRHPWRDLHSILAVKRLHGALALNHIYEIYDGSFMIWTGGLINDQGKPIQQCEWNFQLDVKSLGESFQQIYQIGLSLTQSAEYLLRMGIVGYYNELGEKNIKNNTKRKKVLEKSIGYFWSILDSHYQDLINCAISQEDKLNNIWYPIVRRAMEDAYAFACPHTTPRQIQAFALGRSKLRLKKFEEGWGDSSP